VARRESFRGPVPFWPLIFLATPIVLALAMNTGKFLPPAIAVSVLLAFWILSWLRNVFFGGEINVGLIITNLLAGIVFVDWLAVVPQCNIWQCLLFFALFGLTKLLQNFVPAT
jgi:hypothetical protein